ncbi:MAG: hypothetical protein LH473_02395 [Chitinophagales bacterium]|nr:hypothetical protein [Chitinophagales bacterium]
MFFNNIIGQSVVKEKLMLSVQHNRVSHAQLFLGPEGNGSLALALAYAQFINCEKKLENDSCGKCSSCIKAQKMIHPDIHFSFPVFKLKTGSENPALSSDFSKQWREAVVANPYQNLNDWLEFISSDNKQGNISAEECRVMIHKLSLNTYESKHKVMIIWLAEYLRKEGNILLKLLEEPPANTLLILIAENREQVLNTILSRCQIIAIPRIDDNDLLDDLMMKHNLNLEAANKILRQSQGNYREALRLIVNTEEDEPEILKRWMRLLIDKKSSVELVKWVEEISRAGREKQKQFLRYTLEFIRECIVMHYSGEAISNLYDEEKKMAAYLLQRLKTEEWKIIDERIEQSHYHIERNASPKILFMNLSLQIQNIISAKKLSLAS